VLRLFTGASSKIGSIHGKAMTMIVMELGIALIPFGAYLAAKRTLV
jgi:hypothetical protein